MRRLKSYLPTHSVFHKFAAQYLCSFADAIRTECAEAKNYYAPTQRILSMLKNCAHRLQLTDGHSFLFVSILPAFHGLSLLFPFRWRKISKFFDSLDVFQLPSTLCGNRSQEGVHDFYGVLIHGLGALFADDRHMLAAVLLSDQTEHHAAARQLPAVGVQGAAGAGHLNIAASLKDQRWRLCRQQTIHAI